MTILVRAATMTNFEQVASACGLDARGLLGEAGLPVQSLADPDLMVPAAAVGALLELAAERAGEPAFGLRMAASRRLSNLGPLGLLLRDQPTLRQALEALIARIHLHNEAMSVSVVPEGPIVAIREEMVYEGGQSVRQPIELAMGTTFRLLGIFLGEGWRPRLVTFRHPAPSSRAWHRHVFGDSVAFGEEFNEIVCNAADLEAPNPGADPVMARYSKRLLERDPGKIASMSDRVRRLIVLLMPRGHCRVESVAQHLGVDRRTVANHLAAEKTTFSILVDTMRRELLAHYLRDASRPLSDVATLLGFSELSAFSRWHRRQFGVAPRTRRAGVAPGP
ncbi:AraC family transcriptional regulator ligand-binding domain-containing protein [Variovorax sp. LjRoot290]|uniref:AraC family transcriptional regulator n=1 Tax=Variovorax sp. LjRoot290 TaxID=3342316 RepID=UPI003ECC4E46